MMTKLSYLKIYKTMNQCWSCLSCEFNPRVVQVLREVACFPLLPSQRYAVFLAVSVYSWMKTLGLRKDINKFASTIWSPSHVIC